MRKWFVCKVKDDWCAYDREGNNRFSGPEWLPVYTFARMGAEELHPPIYFRVHKFLRRFRDNDDDLW